MNPGTIFQAFEKEQLGNHVIGIFALGNLGFGALCGCFFGGMLFW